MDALFPRRIATSASKPCGESFRRRPDIGSRHGYFSPDEESEIVDEINRLEPDFIWSDSDTPKQQEWIHRHKAAIRRGVIFAVGFAFDVNAGRKSDPGVDAASGINLALPACSEPGRLLTRYLRFNTLFLIIWSGMRLSASSPISFGALSVVVVLLFFPSTATMANLSKPSSKA